MLGLILVWRMMDSPAPVAARTRDSVWQHSAVSRGWPVLMSALSGVEMALRDVKGKALGAPVYELLGGRVRDASVARPQSGGHWPVDPPSLISLSLPAPG